jgi:hypothetical protein
MSELMSQLDAVAAEIEAHVGASGWDQRPVLFALVRAGQLAADDPATTERLGLAGAPADALVPVEQQALPDQPLDEVLAHLEWPDKVSGCALCQEIVLLPPSAEADVADPQAAATHPDRREARLVVAVLRAGGTASMLRLRGRDEPDDGELLTGPDLAPNLAEALHTTFA